jgi:hypothetical protein
VQAAQPAEDAAIRPLLVLAFEATDLLEDALDVGGRDGTILRPKQRDELVANRSLEVPEDLRPIGIVRQSRAGAVEILREEVVCVTVQPELSGVPVQADDDRLIHGSPSQFVDECGQGGPVGSKVSELGPSHLRQAVVLARRPGRRFAPVVVEQAFAAHLAEQRVVARRPRMSAT